jgi:hypothetical protein
MAATAVRSAPRVARPESERPSGATWVWAAAGAAGVALALSSWVRWIAAGDPNQPSAIGPDEPGTAAMVVLRSTEIAAGGVFIALLYWSLIRPWRARQGMTLDGKLFLGGVFASSCDVMISFFNPTWAFNAHAVSLGTWGDHFPGYGSPGQGELPWGTLWCLPAYIFLGLGAALVGSAILRFLRPRLPRASSVSLFAIVLVCFYGLAFCLELLWTRGEVYNYVSVPGDLSLWAGTTNQIPVYSPLLLGLYCLGFTWLRESKDDRGRSAVERDIDRLSLAPRSKALASTLAVIGFAFAVTLAAYQVPWSWLAMKGDSHPELPSYMRSGIYCGQQGQPLCANQYLEKLRSDNQAGN